MPPLTLRSRLRRSIGPDVDGYYFVLPTVIIMVSLIVYPFCLAVWYSMSNAFIGEETHFVGLENFMYLIFEDDIFLLTIRNTLLFAVISVVVKVVLGLLCAMLLLRIIKLRRFLRGAMLLPFVAPTALTTLAWWLILDPTYSHINWVLQNTWPFTYFDLGPYNFLGEPTLALGSVIFVNIWRGLPFFIITILAGLVAIPDHLYEAAEIDGATTMQKFWKITLPLLKPVLAVIILFSTIFTLADFNIVFVLTRGGPMNETHLFATYSFTAGVLNHEIGLGAAIALFLFPILIVTVILLLRLVRRDSEYEL
ncbi:MAG: sugar ABC transporter permease [Rhodospirillaceae bacterium]|nr:sugar ABC transporter permease [Rhodospirillaceae bacterium]MBT5667699.1 sugar ABC transporter permease [Rhodospirillaceae bacterium]